MSDWIYMDGWVLGSAMAVIAVVVVIAFIGISRRERRMEDDPWEIWRDD